MVQHCLKYFADFVELYVKKKLMHISTPCLQRCTLIPQCETISSNFVERFVVKLIKYPRHVYKAWLDPLFKIPGHFL
jgi:hypothetical protein